MNITYDQALALGGPLAEAARRAMEQEKQMRPTQERIQVQNPDGMNKTERRFRAEVAPHVVKISREPFKIRLAGRTFYTPDFVVYPNDDGPALVEVKGHMRDDAAVKLKTAASLYPEFRWLLVRAAKGGWDVREVTDRGIGRERVAVAWIPGSCAREKAPATAAEARGGVRTAGPCGGRSRRGSRGVPGNPWQRGREHCLR